MSMDDQIEHHIEYLDSHCESILSSKTLEIVDRILDLLHSLQSNFGLKVDQL